MMKLKLMKLAVVLIPALALPDMAHGLCFPPSPPKWYQVAPAFSAGSDELRVVWTLKDKRTRNPEHYAYLRPVLDASVEMAMARENFRMMRARAYMGLVAGDSLIDGRSVYEKAKMKLQLLKTTHPDLTDYITCVELENEAALKEAKEKESRLKDWGGED